MSQWTLICNPTSGGYRPEVPGRLSEALSGHGIGLHVLHSEHPGHAEALARGVEGADCVAVYGGDGTLREVAKGLRGRDVPVAFLPGGTGNNTARELGLPFDPVSAALAVVPGREVPIRLGHLNGEPFVNNAGIGFDGYITSVLTPALKRRLGAVAYTAMGFRALVHRHPHVRVHTPAGREHRAVWVVGARAQRYSGPLRIHPTVHMTRPVLGLTAVSGWMLVPFGVGRLLLHLPVRGPGLAFEEHEGFRVTSEEPVHAQVDGDWLAQGTAFEVGLLEPPVTFRLPAAF